MREDVVVEENSILKILRLLLFWKASARAKKQKIIFIVPFCLFQSVYCELKLFRLIVQCGARSIIFLPFFDFSSGMEPFNSMVVANIWRLVLSWNILNHGFGRNIIGFLSKSSQYLAPSTPQCTISRKLFLKFLLFQGV